jgi:hypothetical protein
MRRNLTRWRLRFLVPAIFAALADVFFAAPASNAATYFWQTTKGDWSTAANWGGAEPTSSDTAYIGR